MSDYDETFLRIRKMTRRHQAVIKEHEAETAKEAGALIARFLAAGWSLALDLPCAAVCVEVCDLNGDLYEWYVESAADLEACLKALEAAERAAREVK